MADTSVLKKYFQNYLSSLKETSYDKNNKEYLCYSNKEVVNFDDFTQNTSDFAFKKSKSCDALYLPDDRKEVYCIEFKNGKIKNDNIKGKYIASLINLQTIFQKENIAVKNYQFYFFVVYKNPTNMGAYKNRGLQNEIQFGLDDEKEKYKYNYIICNSIIKTEPKDNFKRYYGKFFKNNIKCFDISNEFEEVYE